MDADDAEWRQAFGAGGAHIVFGQNFQHGRARLAGDDGERNGGEHDRRQNEVAECRGKRPLLAGNQAVDQHEAGDLREIEHQRDATRYREPLQGARKQDDQQQTPPEDRHGITDQCDAHQALIEDRASLDCGNDTGGNAERDRYDDGTERQFDRCREQCQELIKNRLLRDDRGAEVAGEYAAEIIEILHDHRPVHAELRTDLRVTLRRHDALTRKERNRITRQKPDEGEGDDGDPDESRDQDGEAPQKEAKHFKPLRKGGWTDLGFCQAMDRTISASPPYF
ncbi:hypothetical protein D3C80_338700 [compost metagenome]